jgi:hypothetical protein
MFYAMQGTTNAIYFKLGLKFAVVNRVSMNILMMGNRNSGKMETCIPVGGNHLTSA